MTIQSRDAVRPVRSTSGVPPAGRRFLGRAREVVVFRAFLPLGLAGALITAVSAQSESTHFRLEPVAIDAAGGPAVGSSQTINGSLAQELVIGTSSSPRFVLQSGFWAFSGSGLVPVYLHATSSPQAPGDVHLAWSGNNPPYTLYRSPDCARIFDSPLVFTPANDYTDHGAPATGLTCYNVLATAPGPAPP